MSAKTTNRWIIALVTVSVLALAAPQSAAAASAAVPALQADLSIPALILAWVAQAWDGLGQTFDASTSDPGNGSPTPGTSSGEQGGMIDPNG